MKSITLIMVMVIAAQSGAQQPTELFDCLDDTDGPNFCSDSTAVLVDDGCGVTFNRYRGRIAWPVLWNVGPVTISVRTRQMDFAGLTRLPLYVQVVNRQSPNDPRDCRTWAPGGFLVLVAQGGPDCGGTWETVGPISLASYGVQLGQPYNIQIPFFESLPSSDGRYYFHSVGFSCIRVTSHPTAIGAITWTNVKVLYR